MKTKVVILLLIYSCVDQNPPITIYTLTNNTEYQIRIESFARNRESDVITNESIRGDDIIIHPFGNVMNERVFRDNRTFYSIRNVDSVRLIFNDLKLKTYTCEDWPNFNSCSTIFKGDSDKGFEHIITQEDFNAAEDLN